MAKNFSKPSPTALATLEQNSFRPTQAAGIKRRTSLSSSREETLMLEVPREKVVTVPSTPKSPAALATTNHTNKAATSKQPIVPPTIVRSSKLAAMARNLKRHREAEVDVDIDDDQEEEEEEQPDNDESDSRDDDSLVKLENVLIVPDMVTEEFSREVEERAAQNGGGSGSGGGNTTPSSLQASLRQTVSNSNNASPATNEDTASAGNCSPDVADVSNGSFGNLDFMMDPTLGQERSNDDRSNLSVSCVNPAAMSENTYRLGAM